MAEGWAKHFSKDNTIYSAGIEAHGLNPFAVEVMAEAGIDISDQQSTKLSEVPLDDCDLVITVCGDADERCPVLPGSTRKEHWPLEDPARLEGSHSEILAGFRASRDEIRDRVRQLIPE